MPEKITCPNCGEENYTTDPVCISCGASLIEPRPTVSSQLEQPESEEQHGAPPAQERAKPSTETWKEKAADMPALLKATLVSVAIALVETLLFMLLYKVTVSSTVLPELQGFVSVAVFGIVYGAVRGLMLGFILQQQRWSPTVGLLLGFGFGFIVNGWVAPVFGGIAGFVIGIIIEQSLPAEYTGVR